MSLVTPAELATFTGASPSDPQLQPALDLAEAQIATVGLRVERLDERTTQTIKIRPHTSFEQLLLTDGVFTAITEVRVDGEVRAVEWSASNPWYIVDWDNGGFTRLIEVEVDGTLGWNAGNLPPMIKQAILQHAAKIKSNPSGGSTVASERLGDYAVSYFDQSDAGDTASGVNATVTQMLARYRRPWV